MICLFVKVVGNMAYCATVPDGNTCNEAAYLKWECDRGCIHWVCAKHFEVLTSGRGGTADTPA